MTGKKRILVADDSKTALMITNMALAKKPYDVDTAGDGEEAITKALAERPDLIVLDIVMPKLDGFETCRRLRNHASTRDVPIIMLTTRGESENIQTGVQSGCTEYLTKPLNVPEFLAKVKAHLGE
jgi:DNA-binding response OmpR family regulator